MAAPQTLTTGTTSPQIERIRGGTQLRIIIMKTIGCVLIILSAGFVIILIKDPELAKSSGPAMLNVVVAAIFSLVGFVVGRKTGEQD
jgi:hypothetical protein